MVHPQYRERIMPQRSHDPTTPARRALITGATAGLGLEFARQLAASGHDLVLVARDATRLRETADALTAEHGVQVEVLSADLAVRDQVDLVAHRLSDDVSPVSMLVNNAGFGLARPFHANDVEEEQRHLDALVTAPLRLTHAAIRAMRARHDGTIITVASVAAYSPRGTYGAAKSWALSFTRWANLEYRRDGVTVSAVVPGFVRTEFHERMRVRTDTIPSPLWLHPPRVVHAALAGARRGRAVVVPSTRYKFIVAASRLLPDRLVAAGALKPKH